MPSERPASALLSGGLLFVLGYLHVNGPAGRAAQKATHVILLCRHGGEKQTSSNRRDRLYVGGGGVKNPENQHDLTCGQSLRIVMAQSLQGGIPL